MLLSRQKPAVGGAGSTPEKEKTKQKKMPRVEDLLENRDYTGAITLLEFNKHTGKGNEDTDLWIAYCFFHLGEYKKAYELSAITLAPIMHYAVGTNFLDSKLLNSDLMVIYLALSQRRPGSKHISLNLGCCCFYLGMYDEALEYCKKDDEKSPLQNRLMFHLSHKFNDEKQLMGFHQNLQDNFEDQLSLASIHYMRSHYQEAIDIYKRLLLENSFLQQIPPYQAADVMQQIPPYQAADVLQQIPPYQAADVDYQAADFGDEFQLLMHHSKFEDCVLDQLCLGSLHYMRGHYHEAVRIYKQLMSEDTKREILALNVYVALCYYKLDYYDVSQEVLAVYLQNFPDSAIALNLKACNHFRLYNGKAAEAELKHLQEISSPSFTFAGELLKHNMVVFRGGEGALQTLPPLIDVITEARLNLVIYYLKQDDILEAYNLIKDVDPSTPQEYILKGVVNASLGQEQGSREHLKIAQQYFQLVGGSASECDTIPGRQCMASCFFLLKQFDDVLIYLNSVKSYFYSDDRFNFNYAQAKAASGNFKEAEEVFLLITNEKIRNDYVYLSWLARCYIMNKKPRLAWELYLKMDTSGESFSILQLIANDCYKMGQFYHAAKAFDVLERLDPNPEYWEGKRGACVGIFQMILAGHEPRETLREILILLRNTTNPQVEYIVRTIKKWGKEQRLNVQ